MVFVCSVISCALSATENQICATKGKRTAENKTAVKGNKPLNGPLISAHFQDLAFQSIYDPFLQSRDIVFV